MSGGENGLEYNFEDESVMAVPDESEGQPSPVLQAAASIAIILASAAVITAAIVWISLAVTR